MKGAADVFIQCTNVAGRLANPEFLSSYILWDGHRTAPPGFGFRVAGKKTYVIRRKVNGRSIMSTVGNVADFNVLADARRKAADMARVMLDSGMNPNELARQRKVNPFDVLTLNRHYRTQTQKSREREEQSKRNPLKPGSTQGAFLEAAWSKRLTNDNETGIR